MNFWSAFLKSPWRSLLLLCAVVLSYGFFLSTARIQNFVLFHPKETVSWVSSDGSLYRVAAKGNLDSIILTDERFREFALNLKIANPQNCGFIYDYLDSQNYQFVFFENKLRKIIAGAVANGKTRILKTISFTLEIFPGIQFQKQKNQVELYVNGQKALILPGQELAGRLGLMLNEINTPQTIFYNISATGVLDTGQMIRADFNLGIKEGIQKLLLSFLVFFVLFGFLMALVKNPFENYEVNFHPWIVHVFLAAAFFWPFVTKGEVAIFSYDNLGEIFPLFYFSKHNFENILNGQAPWLWNGLVHNGFPFCFNHWDMIYYPLNWPVFLFSDQSLMFAVTLKSFIEVIGIGILGYGFFVRELGSPRWALLASVTYQVCSILIFTMTVFPATSLYFSMTFYLYMLWSIDQRRTVHNILWLTTAIVFVLTSANVAFIFYACLSLGVITIYRWLTIKKELAFSFFKVMALAWGLGFMVSAIRILSCLQGVMSSNRMAENFHTIHDRFYMILRLFIPEMAGWLGPQTFPVLMSSNLNLIFRQLDLPSNPQNNFFIYFGVVPALFLLMAIVVKVPGKFQFWKIYSLVVLAMGLLWQPVWGILSILSFPLNHYSYHSVMIPVGISMLTGWMGMSWEQGQYSWTRIRKPFLITVALVILLFCVFETYLFPQLTQAVRIELLLAMGLLASYFFIKYYASRYLRPYQIIMRWTMVWATTVGLVFLTLILMIKPIPHKIQVVPWLILPIYWGLLCLVIWLNVRLDSQDSQDKRFSLSRWAGYLLSGGVGFVLAESTIGPWFAHQPQSLLIYGLDIGLGSIRFVLILQVFLLGFLAVQDGRIRIRPFSGLLLIVTMLDLVAFNARFNDITAPFYYHQAFYPKAFYYRDLNPHFKSQVDTTHYRVNHLHRLDYGANKNLVFGIPSYSGTVGYMTKRFSTFLTNFGYPPGIYMLYPEDSTDHARFLDLSAVGYDVQPDKSILRRPNSLSRLNVLYSAEVITDDAASLMRLKADAFDPLTTVILSKDTGLMLNASGAKFQPVTIQQNRPDRLIAQVQNQSPALLLFVESFDEGWKAFVDGKPVPVIRANYNFMACELAGPGNHSVRFEYTPQQYYRNLKISLAGLLVWALLFAVSWFPSLKKNN